MLVVEGSISDLAVSEKDSKRFLTEGYITSHKTLVLFKPVVNESYKIHCVSAIVLLVLATVLVAGLHLGERTTEHVDWSRS